VRSRIEPLKKIARSMRQHRELILNYFRAQKLLSSGVVEGLNNKAKVTMRRYYASGPSASSNSIIHLASCPSPNLPTIFLTSHKGNAQEQSKRDDRGKSRAQNAQ
jgi:transposase